MQAGIEAVFEGLQQADAILARLAFLDVVVGADPGDEAAFVLRLRRGVAEDNDEPTIGQVNTMVPISGEAPGGIHGLGPCLSLVVAEHDKAGAAAAVLAHETTQFIAVGRAEGIRLARVLTIKLRAIAREDGR
ncbi:MAG: hypothetical protein EBS83_12405 [Planctomycetia bacterium]|nr:hypothetical protein [Planctomycetia bacterium]